MALATTLLALAVVRTPLGALVPASSRLVSQQSTVRMAADRADGPQIPSAAAATVSSWSPLWLSVATSGAILARAPWETMPRLLILHLCGLVPMLPLGAAARIAVRKRLQRSTTKQQLSPTAKKNRATSMVKAHAVCSGVALYAGIIGVVSIFLNKAAAGRPHLTSLHGRIGAATIACWFATYAVAQPEIWRDVWRRLRRDGSFKLKPRYLWGSTRHRNFGNGAISFSLMAIATGVSGKWGRDAFGLPFAAAICASVFAIGLLTFGESIRPPSGPSRRKGQCS
eukprot:scaffold43345_cov26-Tisochrysis_lutea.AAC.1